MRRVPLLAVAAGICLLGPALVSISPAAAAGGTITVTPNTDLGREAQSVAVDGAGWPGSVQVGVCQGVVNGTPDQNDCADSFGVLVDTTPTGTFSTNLSVKRIIFIPSLGRNVDCASEDCYVAASVFSDIPNTAVFTRITFSKDLADGRIRRRSDGAIAGDNVYNSVAGTVARHTITPGGDWTYALQVQNDGPTAADITVNAGTSSNDGVSPQMRLFVGYYDVTSSMLASSGFTFTDVAPGEIRTFALQFHALASARVGSEAEVSVGLTSGTAGITDRLNLFVDVVAPT